MGQSSSSEHASKGYEFRAKMHRISTETPASASFKSNILMALVWISLKSNGPLPFLSRISIRLKFCKIDFSKHVKTFSANWCSLNSAYVISNSYSLSFTILLRLNNINEASAVRLSFQFSDSSDKRITVNRTPSVGILVCGIVGQQLVLTRAELYQISNIVELDQWSSKHFLYL